MNFIGKQVIVSGGGSGIVEDVARNFAKIGRQCCNCGSKRTK